MSFPRSKTLDCLLLYLWISSSGLLKEGGAAISFLKLVIGFGEISYCNRKICREI